MVSKINSGKKTNQINNTLSLQVRFADQKAMYGWIRNETFDLFLAMAEAEGKNRNRAVEWELEEVFSFFLITYCCASHATERGFPI